MFRAGILFDTSLLFTFHTGRTFEGVKVRPKVYVMGKVFNERCLMMLGWFPDENILLKDHFAFIIEVLPGTE